MVDERTLIVVSPSVAALPGEELRRLLDDADLHLTQLKDADTLRMSLQYGTDSYGGGHVRWVQWRRRIKDNNGSGVWAFREPGGLVNGRHVLTLAAEDDGAALMEMFDAPQTRMSFTAAFAVLDVAQEAGAVA